LASIITNAVHHAVKRSEIVDELRTRIISGEFPPGSRLPSYAQIAEEFNSCRVTAQHAMRYLHEAGHVVIEQRIGAFVSKNPPNLCNIGIVIDRPKESADTSVFQNALRAEVEKWRLKKSPSGQKWQFSHYYGSVGFSEARDREALLHSIHNQRFAGLIFLVGMCDPSVVISDLQLELLSTPKIVIGNKYAGMHSVQLDYDAFFTRALDYLHERGRKRIGFLLLCSGVQTLADTYEKLQPQVEARGMTTKPQWMHGTIFELKSWATSYIQLLMQCRGDDRPDALIIGDDHFVPEVTQVVLGSGVEVPKEFEVVAFAVFPTPTPSAVPATRLGFNASQLFGTKSDRPRFTSPKVKSSIFVAR